MPYTYYERADGTVCRRAGDASRDSVIGCLSSEINTHDPAAIRLAMRRRLDRLNVIERAAWRCSQKVIDALNFAQGLIAIAVEGAQGLAGVKGEDIISPGELAEANHQIWEGIGLIRATMESQEELRDRWLDLRATEAAQRKKDEAEKREAERIAEAAKPKPKRTRRRA